MLQYYLMHKDNRCGLISYDETTGRIAEYHNYNTGYAPFLDSCDITKMKKWWEMRAAPASRKLIQDAIKRTSVLNPYAYLAQNLALSMVDSYWICPVGTDLHYADIKLSNFIAYNAGRIPYHNTSSYDYNASLGGVMEKYWDVNGAVPVLVKESYKHFGQQAVNEVFATYLHQLQNAGIPFVKYTAQTTEDHGIICKCDSFTSDQVELVPAAEILSSANVPNDISAYEAYIQICSQNGIPEEQIRDFMDYQTLTDFLISNTDEHLLNFGVLRDTDTMKLIGPAPVFDSGNSMLYDSSQKVPYDRVGLLGIKINGIYSQEEKMLAQVKNRNIVKTDALPSPADVEQMYADAGIPEYKAHVISAAYQSKYEMLEEFQHGLKISLYHEKQKLQEKQPDSANIVSHTKTSVAETEFVMTCGVPSKERTGIANKHYAAFISQGKTPISSSSLYSLSSIFYSKGLVDHTESILKRCPSITNPGNAVTFISLKDIEDELDCSPYASSQDRISLIAAARVKTALSNKISVVFDGDNTDRKSRQYFCQLAASYGARTSLDIVFPDKDMGYSGNVLQQYARMIAQLQHCPPTPDEGWDSINQHGEYPSLDLEEPDIIQDHFPCR